MHAYLPGLGTGLSLIVAIGAQNAFVLRQGLLLIPLLYLLNAVFGLNGAVLGQSITDYVTIALSCVVWRRIRHGLEQRT